MFIMTPPQQPTAEEKVKITKLDNGNLELRSTDFEALQQEKRACLECKHVDNKGVGKCWGKFICGFHKKNGKYQVKESWSEYDVMYKGKKHKVDHVIILEKLK